MNKIELRKVKHYGMINWFKESYTAQDVLIVHVNYPRYIYQGDYVDSVYNDRESDKWLEAIATSQLCNHPDNWIGDATEEQIMKFAKTLFADQNIEGCQVVRHTNVSNGYPLWRLDVFKSKNKGVQYDFNPNYEIKERLIL